YPRVGNRPNRMRERITAHRRSVLAGREIGVGSVARVGITPMSAPEHAPAGTDPEVRREIVETVRRFVARDVVPVASRLEHEDRFPEPIIEPMRELGLFGVTIPRADGGLGLDLLTYVGVVEELAYGWMSLSGIVNTHTMVATLIVQHGTEEQKRRWLPQLASGERRGALSLSEPDAGSDTRNISCRAVR